MSEHVYGSDRRAGFHWLADAYADAGWHVCFVTVGVSPFSNLKRDYRLGLVPRSARNRMQEVRNNFQTYFWYPTFHPFSLKNALANKLSGILFGRYGNLSLGTLEAVLRAADTIVLESAAGLALVPRLRRMAPHAFLVYRVSDDLRVVGGHPVLTQFESRALSSFDLVSVPSEFMVPLFPETVPVKVQRHGLKTALFDQINPNPYQGGGNVISVGTTLFDRDVVEMFATVCRDLTFHLFGAISPTFAQPNIVLHGERPFVELVPYLQHADIGLAPYRYRPGCEYLSHTSNKIMQYTYCRLPVLLPDFIPCNATNVAHYRPGNRRSIYDAAMRALAIDRKTIDIRSIHTWAVLQNEMEASRVISLGERRRV